MPLSFFLIRTLIRKRDTVIGKFHCLHYSRSSFEGAERQQPGDDTTGGCPDAAFRLANRRKPSRASGGSALQSRSPAGARQTSSSFVHPQECTLLSRPRAVGKPWSIPFSDFLSFRDFQPRK